MLFLLSLVQVLGIFLTAFYRKLEIVQATTDFIAYIIVPFKDCLIALMIARLYQHQTLKNKDTSSVSRPRDNTFS